MGKIIIKAKYDMFLVTGQVDCSYTTEKEIAWPE